MILERLLELARRRELGPVDADRFGRPARRLQRVRRLLLAFRRRVDVWSLRQRSRAARARGATEVDAARLKARGLLGLDCRLRRRRRRVRRLLARLADELVVL